jgi:hypothetical protein
VQWYSECSEVQWEGTVKSRSSTVSTVSAVSAVRLVSTVEYSGVLKVKCSEGTSEVVKLQWLQ